MTDKNTQPPSTQAVRITALWIYPVKSLGAMAVPSARLTPFGLQGDRTWMVVDDAGNYVTQRQHPALARISARLEDETLILSNREGETCAVDPPASASTTVTIWRDTCLAQPAPEQINRWLTRAAGAEKPLHLVRFDRRQPRAAKPERFGAATTHFADAAPYLITSEQSLTALNTHLTSANHPPAGMQRFRPNIVTDGLPAFAEHRTNEITNDTLGARLQLVDHCQRCAIITIDPTTGEKNALHLLSEIAAINPMPGKPKAPAFGVNSVLGNGDGQIIEVGQIWLAK